jgi:hypothetical protein
MKTHISLILLAAVAFFSFETDGQAAPNPNPHASPQVVHAVGQPIKRSEVNLNAFHGRHKEALPQKGATGKKVGCNLLNPYCATKHTNKVNKTQ